MDNNQLNDDLSSYPSVINQITQGLLKLDKAYTELQRDYNRLRDENNRLKTQQNHKKVW